MTIPGYDQAAAAYDYAQPADFPLVDDPGVHCPDDLDEPCELTCCYLCGGTVCEEHDEVERCDGYLVHEVCHHQGCPSTSCAQDRYDDHRIEEAEASRDEEYR